MMARALAIKGAFATNDSKLATGCYGGRARICLAPRAVVPGKLSGT